MRQPVRPASNPGKVWLAGGSVAFLAAIAVLPSHFLSQPQVSTHRGQCQIIVQKEARLSREQLSQFLALPEQSAKSAVQAVIQVPYCELTTTESSITKEAYPLAFDPETWFVIEYTNEVYSGYEFTFRQAH